MKKAYSTPKLIVHGRVEEITGMYRGLTAADTSVDPSGNIVGMGRESIRLASSSDRVASTF